VPRCVGGFNVASNHYSRHQKIWVASWNYYDLKIKTLQFQQMFFFFNLNFSSSLFHVREIFIINKILGVKTNARK
jgi:hypothetical protein